MKLAVREGKKHASINRFLNPRSIAVVGATSRPGYGQRFVENIVNNRYQGKFFPVNPKYSEIFGVKCYPSISAIGEPIDLAVVIVKAEFVKRVVRECASCGVGACLIITAGFSELDKVNGKSAELSLKKIAEETGMRIIGPNTIGAANVKLNMWINAIGGLDTSHLSWGNAAIISQSGAAGFGPLLNAALDRNVGLKYIVATGNEADLDLCDFLDFMLDDDEICSIAILIEGIRRGREFLRLAAKAQHLGKKLILMKLGESPVGARAAMGHTASMTGDMTVFNAMAKQYGAIKAEDYDELVEYTKMTREPYRIIGNRICVISHSGGISGFLGDQLCMHGFEIPIFSDATQRGIDFYLHGFGSPRNPLDLTSQTGRPTMIEIMKVVGAGEEVDAYVFATHGNKERMEILLKSLAHLKKPCYIIWTGTVCSDGLEMIRQSQLPLSFSIQKFAKMLWCARQSDLVVPVPEKDVLPMRRDFGGKSGYLNEAQGKAILETLGMEAPPRCIITDWNSFEARGAPFSGPYVMKLLSNTVIHKSDIGGVKLGLKDMDELKKAYEEIVKNALDAGLAAPEVLLEQMCGEGLDMMLGVRVDSTFGPVVLAGLGGIYTELFRMVSCRLAPVESEGIECMLEEIPGLGKLLAGYRGAPAYDKKSLVSLIEKLSDFVLANEGNLELVEINPVRVMQEGGGAQILDCVIKFI